MKMLRSITVCQTEAMSFRPAAGKEMEAAATINQPLPILLSSIALLNHGLGKMANANF
jgi:hypothetical protein